MKSKLRQRVLILATLLALALTIALGCWQLSRAAYKESLQARMQARSALPVQVFSLAQVQRNPSAWFDRAVRVQGVWDAAHTVYLDNRQMQGRVGFFVLTPLVLPSGEALLVQRGWVARNFQQRLQVPTILTPTGMVTIEGRIAPAPGKLYQMAAQETGAIRQNIDVPAFARETGHALLTFSVQQTDPASQGLLRDWPAPDVGVAKHYGYAFQWFALAVLIVVLFVWFQVIRRQPRRVKDISHV